MDLIQIRKQIINQTDWSEEEMDEEIESMRLQLIESTGGMEFTVKDDLETILQSIVDDYDEIKIEEFKIEIPMGERVKYSDITLEEYPEKPEDADPNEFWNQNVFQGKCVAGCVTAKFHGKYLPAGFEKKVKMITAYINDDTDEFKMLVFGKNPELIEQWEDIHVGDYIEATKATIVQGSDENPDYDKEKEVSDENSKYIPNGKPQFMLWFGGENTSSPSQVQKISREKYPELPTLHDLFEVKTMSVFLSGGEEGKARFIVNGVIFSVQQATKGTIRCNFLVLIGAQKAKVNATLSNEAVKILPKKDGVIDKEAIKRLNLEVLGFYDSEAKTFSINKIISQKEMAGSRTKKKTLEKATKARSKKEKDKTIEDEINDTLDSLLGDNVITFDVETMQSYGLSPKWKKIQVHEALEKMADEIGLECVNDLLPEWKFKEDSESESEEEPEDIKEQALSDEEHVNDIEQHVFDSIRKKIDNPAALKNMIPVMYQHDKEIVNAVYEDMLKDNKIEEYMNGEKVRKVDVKEPEIIDTDKENEDEVKAFFRKNSNAKGYTVKQLTFRFKDKFDEKIINVLKRLEDKEYKVGKFTYVIKEIKKDVWRRIKK